MTAEELFKERAGSMYDLAMQTRAFVFSVIPDAVETVELGYGNVLYGRKSDMSGMCCYISMHKAHINLGFASGSSLPDPDKLLQGTGKHMRHVKIKRAEDLQKSALRQLVEKAFAA